MRRVDRRRERERRTAPTSATRPSPSTPDLNLVPWHYRWTSGGASTLIHTSVSLPPQQNKHILYARQSFAYVRVPVFKLLILSLYEKSVASYPNLPTKLLAVRKKLILSQVQNSRKYTKLEKHNRTGNKLRQDTVPCNRQWANTKLNNRSGPTNRRY